MNKYNFLSEMSWMAGISPAQWDLFVQDAWDEEDMADATIDEAAGKQLLLISLILTVLLAAPAVWAVLSIV